MPSSDQRGTTDLIPRPGSTVFGLDTYPTLLSKAAALMRSPARNHAFLDGDRRTAWTAAWTFPTVNGIESPST